MKVTTEFLQTVGCTAYQIKKYFQYRANKAGADTVTRRVYLEVLVLIEKFNKDQAAAEKQMKYFPLNQVIDNPEIPENIQLNVLEINEVNLINGEDPILGVGIEPNFKGDQNLTWWVWDNGQNRRWFNRKNELATSVKGKQRYYYTAVRTYINRLRKGLPFYG